MVKTLIYRILKVRRNPGNLLVEMRHSLLRVDLLPLETSRRPHCLLKEVGPHEHLDLKLVKIKKKLYNRLTRLPRLKKDKCPQRSTLHSGLLEQLHMSLHARRKIRPWQLRRHCILLTQQQQLSLLLTP